MAVFCFGELLLRMSPSLGGHWINDARMPVYIGGAELNVATALANWNIPVGYSTVLPSNYLSAEIVEEIKARKIDTAAIHYSGERIGIYYLPQGADLKHTGVIYDRAHSSFADLQPGTIDWKKVLKGYSWFHFSAISPALTANVAEVCEEALQAASSSGMKISVDLNYRARLWQYGVQPVKVMPDLVKYCHVIMGNVWSVESLLGIASPVSESTGRSKEELIAAAGQSMLQLHKQFPRAESFAYTFRLDKEYFAVLQHGPEQAVSPTTDIGEIIDRVGSGDCFMGGLIYGLYKKNKPAEVIDFAAAAAVGKLYETGDATRQTVDDILARINKTTNA